MSSSIRPVARLAGYGAVAATALISGIALPAAAAPSSNDGTVYVSPSGQGGNSGTSCGTATYSTISDAVGADGVATGGTVIVCKGVYHEFVNIVRPLTLAGRPGAVVDATGIPIGIAIGGDDVTVEGMTVEHATPSKSIPLGDGIATLGLGAQGPQAGNHDLIIDNVAKDNVGNGIDLNTTFGSSAVGNVTKHDGVGINVTDDLGRPSHNNRVIDNVSNANNKGCGIVVAEHTGAGVYHNLVLGNTVNHNGTGSDGAGIFLGGGGTTGGTFNNVLKDNSAHGNTLAGIAIHVHNPATRKHPHPKSTAKWSGNRLIGNDLGHNNLGFTHKTKKGKKVRTGDYKDNKSTGLYIGSYEPLKVLASGNWIHNDQIGVFTAGTVKLALGRQEFRSVKRKHVSIKVFAG
jgi:hypothetical protein